VQITLFYKPIINVEQKVGINIAKKLKLKLVKKDLSLVLAALKRSRNQSFHESLLIQVLPKPFCLTEKADKKLKSFTVNVYRVYHK